MKITKQKDARVFRKRGKTSGILAREYPSSHPSLNIAEVIIQGRYPEKGWGMNAISTMIVYVLSGTGRITIQGEQPETFAVGDSIEIPWGEKYAWEPDGIVRMHIASTPAWTAEQCKTVEG